MVELLTIGDLSWPWANSCGSTTAFWRRGSICNLSGKTSCQRGKEIAADAHIPLPVPSSAASIKLDIEGNENLDELASSIGGDGGLCTRREYEYSVDDGLEYLIDMLPKKKSG